MFIIKVLNSPLRKYCQNKCNESKNKNYIVRVTKVPHSNNVGVKDAHTHILRSLNATLDASAVQYSVNMELRLLIMNT